LIVESASGVPFASFLRDNLFLPAAMASTQVYHRRKDGASIANYAYGYIYDDGRWILPDDSPSENFVIPLDGVEGDGAVNSNIHDLLRWDCALRAGSIIPLSAQVEMAAPTFLNDGSTAPYGFGWRIAKDENGLCLHHSGGWPGYKTFFARWLDRGITIILLTNQTGVDAYGSNSLVEGIKTIAVNGGTPKLACFDDLVDRGYDRSRYPRFAGDYEQQARITCEGDRLFITLVLHGQEFTAEVFPIGNDVFISRKEPMPVEFAFDGSSIRYAVNANPQELKRI
jgi:CubicO group peptidase (beta-lactamase class C family)